MKYILEIILTTVVIFFVWNMLKRLFFTSIFKFPRPNQQTQSNPQEPKKDLKSKIHWDAETVEYEEVKDKNNS